MITPDKKFMEQAIALGRESAEEGDYSLGVVIVLNGEVIGKGKTRLKHKNDPTAHGEIEAIRDACNHMNSRYLEGAILYTTNEPCSMCTSAAIWAKMKGIVFGSSIEDAKRHAGDNFSWRQIDLKCKDVVSAGTPQPEVIEGFMQEECNALFDLTD